MTPETDWDKVFLIRRRAQEAITKETDPAVALREILAIANAKPKRPPFWRALLVPRESVA